MNLYRVVAQAYDGRIFDLGEDFADDEDVAVRLAVGAAIDWGEPDGFAELHGAGEIADISAHEV